MGVNARIVGGPMSDPAPVVGRALAAMVTEGILLLESRIKPGMPIGVTEAGKGSITNETRYVAGIPIGVVGSPQKHVAVINDGRRPGKTAPKTEVLELWVKRTIKIERVPKRGKNKGKTVTRAPTDKEVKSISFVIARSIGVKGIKGLKFFEKGIEAATPALTRIFAEAGMRITIQLAEHKE